MTSASSVGAGTDVAGADDVAALFDRHAALLWRYCARRVGPHLAEDVVAEVFLVVACHPDRIGPGESAKPWLYGIATNLLRAHHRAERRALRGRSGGALATPSYGQLGDTVATVTAEATLTQDKPRLRAATDAAEDGQRGEHGRLADSERSLVVVDGRPPSRRSGHPGPTPLRHVAAPGSGLLRAQVRDVEVACPITGGVEYPRAETMAGMVVVDATE